MAKRIRYAIIGTGGRSGMFWRALGAEARFKRHNQLVALMDVNETRMDFVLSP